MKRLSTALLSLLLLVSAGVSLVPQRAHALIPVEDIFNVPKEYQLDMIAWTVSRQIIQSITRSTVNWINSGFDGSPAYVTNLERDMLRVGDRVANDFVRQLSQHVSINSPFRDQIVRAVRDEYFRSTGTGAFFNQNRYTLDQVSSNPEAFIKGDMSKGGLSAWNEVWTNPQNNPFSAHEAAHSELSNQVSSAQDTRRTELSWNRGFLSWRGECAEPSKDPSDPIGNQISLSETDRCLNQPIQTPGSVIESQLERTLGSNLEQLGLADEFNEIFAALMTQLMNQVLGQGGLGGLSQLGSGGGRSFLERATDPSLYSNPSQTVGASFGSTLAMQRERITTYRVNWDRVRTAAESARNACADAGPTTGALAQANTAIARADSALEAISQFEDELKAASASQTGNPTTSMQSLATRYQNLLSSLPSASEVTDAEIQGTTGLYAQMTQYAQSCRR